MSEIGARIRQARLAARMGQAELAAACGVSVPTISEWENGRKIPSPGRVRPISEIVGVNVQDGHEMEGLDERILTIKKKIRMNGQRSKDSFLLETTMLKAAGRLMTTAFLEAAMAARSADDAQRAELLSLAMETYGMATEILDDAERLSVEGKI